MNIHTIAAALLACIVVVFLLYVLAVRRALRKPDRYDDNNEDATGDYNWISTTDRAQLHDERDGPAWKRWRDTVPAIARRGTANPFPQPSDERRRP